MWLTTIDRRSTVYNDAEMEHMPCSDWSTCTVFYTSEPKLMHLTDYKLATLAIIEILVLYRSYCWETYVRLGNF